ncbi:MAG: class I SAM-dependent methyltransferase [Thermoanaerobaculia bacterium]|nr:class I SAM-dependent methyltransferase [Thermoanaerobaculia bacterium]
MVSVDLELRNPGLLRSFRRPRQRLHLLQGDSGSAEMIARVRELLPDGVDFLFIDGDHSYEGVRRDFEAYRGLVRPGGLIAFHDIVQDRGSRGGPATVAWSGEVPRFWSEVKADCRHRELIADPDQDGAGIGVLFTPRPDRRSPVEAP